VQSFSSTGVLVITATLPSTDSDRRARTPVDRQKISTRLLGSAAKKSPDPVVDIDRAAPIPEHLYGLSPEWSTLYGTPLWEGLTEDQRVTLTIHEHCSIAGIGIWSECLLIEEATRAQLSPGRAGSRRGRSPRPRRG
jgi:hypothetical protein